METLDIILIILIVIGIFYLAGGNLRSGCRFCPCQSTCNCPDCPGAEVPVPEEVEACCGRMY